MLIFSVGILQIPIHLYRTYFLQFVLFYRVLLNGVSQIYPYCFLTNLKGRKYHRYSTNEKRYKISYLSLSFQEMFYFWLPWNASGKFSSSSSSEGRSNISPRLGRPSGNGTLTGNERAMLWGVFVLFCWRMPILKALVDSDLNHNQNEYLEVD